MTKKVGIAVAALVIALILAAVWLWPSITMKRLLKEELQGSIRFFLEQTNTEEGSAGYGLTRDRYPGNPMIASVAATGFGLSALPLAVENKLLDKEEAFQRAGRTLDTLLAMENVEGFFYHFVNLYSGKREWNSEVSNIDTALLIAGALHAGEYFEGEVREKAALLYERVNWNWFVDKDNNQFYMSYSPEEGFKGHWDFYAEQLILYILAAGSKDYKIDKAVYDGFKRSYSSFGDGEEFIHSWFGSLFTYQFSHGWIDFRDTEDEDGVNWFDNSIHASLANYNYAKSLQKDFKTFEKGAWGMTAADSPKGYNGLLGAAPSGSSNSAHEVDGTVPPAGALGSIVFTPKQTFEAVKVFEEIEGLKGEYGYKDAFNLQEDWVASDYIGIDKGITMVMLANYKNNSVWAYFMQNSFVEEGMKELKINKE